MSKGSVSVAPVRWRRVLLFCIVLFFASYGFVGGFLLMGGSLQDPSFFLFAQVSALMPALVAIGLTRWWWREPVVGTLALKPVWNRWLPITWGLAVALCLLALGAGLLMPNVHWDGSLQSAVGRKLLTPEQLGTLVQIAGERALPPALLLFPAGMLLSLTMSLVAGCGEEFGWRGFVHNELRSLGFWGNAGATGALWLLWHIPLLLLGYGFPDHPGVGGLLMVVHLLVSSVILAYLREKTGTAFAAGLFHGTSEAFALLAVAPLAGGSVLTIGILSLSWLIGELTIACLLLAYDRFMSKQPIAWSPRNR